MASTARAFAASSEPAWHEDASAALAEIEALQLEATAAVRRTVSAEGVLSAELIEREQHAAHGLAWLATYVQAIREMLAYRERLSAEGRFGETEELLTRIGIGEYLAQIFGGRLRPATLSPTASGSRSSSTMPTRGARSAIPVSTRRWKRCAAKSANMPKPKCCRTRMNGTARTNTSRSR
jgi:hypothetical protein